jgi:hypothetical protein
MISLARIEAPQWRRSVGMSHVRADRDENTRNAMAALLLHLLLLQWPRWKNGFEKQTK